MRNRLAEIATGSAVVLMLALCPALKAQQDRPGAAGNRANNAAAGARTGQASGETETIHGVIAAITAEGEAMFDYRSNRAVAAEATFLTVVGSPVKGDVRDANRRETGEANRRDAATDDRSSSNRRRHNVYHVWLTPKTKVCEDWTDHSKTTATNDKETSAQKKEVAIDNLEVGDHVEIQFVANDGSSASQPAHQTDQMARKHGRHRTFVGQATSVTILASKDTNAAPHSQTRERSTSEIQK